MKEFIELSEKEKRVSKIYSIQLKTKIHLNLILNFL